MASELIIELLTKKGIGNIKAVDFLDYSGNTVRCNDAKTAVVKFKENSPNDLHLFLKIFKQGTFLATLNKEVLLHNKEETFYEHLLPFFVDFLKKKVLGRISDFLMDSMCFKYFGSGEVDGDIYLVLEKFSDQQYYVTETEEFHTEDQIHSSLLSIARFHAVSYSMKVMEDVNFPECFPLLEEKQFHLDRPRRDTTWFVRNYKINIKVIRAVMNEINNNNPLVKDFGFELLENSILERLENLGDKIMDVCYMICTSMNDFAVVCHGDFHMGNIAFSREDVNDTKIFDYEIIRYASALTDVHQYLYQVSTPTNRKENLTKYLQSYCDAFKGVCFEIGLHDNQNIFTLNNVLEEYKVTSPWGFLFGFVFLMYRFVPNDTYEKLTSVDGSSEIVDLLKDTPMFKWVIELYIGLIVEAKSNDVISIMEDLVLKG